VEHLSLRLVNCQTVVDFVIIIICYITLHVFYSFRMLIECILH